MNDDIVTLLTSKVNEIAEIEYSSDTQCPPKFYVSIYRNKLILTIVHHEQAFSEDIFPEEEMTYGISNIVDIMKGLYARTM